MRREHRRHLAQAFVTERMAIAVVDALEVIDVGQQHCQRAAAAAGTANLLVQHAVEAPAVGQLGQRVGGAQAQQFGIGGLQSLPGLFQRAGALVDPRLQHLVGLQLQVQRLLLGLQVQGALGGERLGGLQGQLLRRDTPVALDVDALGQRHGEQHELGEHADQLAVQGPGVERQHAIERQQVDHGEDQQRAPGDAEQPRRRIATRPEVERYRHGQPAMQQRDAFHEQVAPQRRHQQQNQHRRAPVQRQRDGHPPHPAAVAAHAEKAQGEQHRCEEAQRGGQSVEARRQLGYFRPEIELAEAGDAQHVEHRTEQIEHVEEVAAVTGEDQQAQVVQHDHQDAAEEQADQGDVPQAALDELLLVDQLQRQRQGFAGLHLQIDHRPLARRQLEWVDEMMVGQRPSAQRQGVACQHRGTPATAVRVVQAHRDPVEHRPLQQQVPEPRIRPAVAQGQAQPGTVGLLAQRRTRQRLPWPGVAGRCVEVRRGHAEHVLQGAELQGRGAACLDRRRAGRGGGHRRRQQQAGQQQQEQTCHGIASGCNGLAYCQLTGAI